MKLGARHADAPVPAGVRRLPAPQADADGRDAGHAGLHGARAVRRAPAATRAPTSSRSRVALYEGLYGHRPFAGDNVVAVMANVVAGTITEPPDRRARAGLDPARSCCAAWRSRPADRFPSMAEMLAALAQRSGRSPTPAVAQRGDRRSALRRRDRRGTHRLSAGQRAHVRGRAGARRGRLGRRAAAGASSARSPRRGHKRAAQAFASAAALIDSYVAPLDRHVHGGLRGDARARRAIGRGARPADGVPGRAAVQRQAR